MKDPFDSNSSIKPDMSKLKLLKSPRTNLQSRELKVQTNFNL